MIWFLIIAGLLTVAALAILLGPVIRQPRPGAEEEETVATLFRGQLAAIDEELTEDRLTPDQAEASRAEITRRMLAAADREPAGSDAQARRASRISWRFGPPIAVAGLLPAAAMAVYFAVGTPAAINRHAGLDTASLGGLNRWCHIWAYKDAAERFAVRERARNEGVWPPRGGQPGVTLKQEEHAGRPGILLAAALASHPRLASRY